jgi:hypothetical protein
MEVVMKGESRDNPHIGIIVTPELISGLQPWIDEAVELGMDVELVMIHLRRLVVRMHRMSYHESLKERAREAERERAERIASHDLPTQDEIRKGLEEFNERVEADKYTRENTDEL